MKTINYFSYVKSRCFMVVVCVSLLMGVTSCSSDDFEGYGPERKKMTDAELVEWALAQMPQTRALAPMPVVMITTNMSVTIGVAATENVVINWGDGSTTPVIGNAPSMTSHSHTYSNNQAGIALWIEGSNQALQNLKAENNGLIYLDITDNTGLEVLGCPGNNLTSIDLRNCPNLEYIALQRNNLSFIDVSNLPNLKHLTLLGNEIDHIDVSNNYVLELLNVQNNPIEYIDLSANQLLKDIDVANTLVTDLDLTQNLNLESINVSNLANLSTINNIPIDSTSFSGFSQLRGLYMAYTPFTSIDLSNNCLLEYINITGTAISYLNVSYQNLTGLAACISNLQDIVCIADNVKNLVYLHICGTPFENNSSKLFPFITGKLPYRNPLLTHSGTLMTTSQIITPLLSFIATKNWIIGTGVHAHF